MNAQTRMTRLVAALACVAVVAGCGAGGPTAGPSTEPSALGSFPRSASSSAPGDSSPPHASPTDTPVPQAQAPTSSTAAADASPTPTSLPPAPASAADVVAWDAAVTAFADRFNALADDAAAAFAPFTDSASILDPSNADFEIGPKSQIVASWKGWIESVDDYRATTTRVFVSRSAAVVLTDVAVAWPSGEPAPMPPFIKEARIFRFAGVPATEVTTLELWYALEGMADGKGTCFELHDCGPALDAFIERYVAAWSGTDVAAIAALYADNAAFVDGVLGISAAGPAEIAAVADARHGGAPAPGCTEEGAYIVTNDGDPAVADWDDPDGGKVAGVLLLTSCRVGPEARTLETAVILMLGRWTPLGYDLDPDGRIVREEVLYDATSAVAAGMVR